jgi:hypothetical protein
VTVNEGQHLCRAHVSLTCPRYRCTRSCNVTMKLSRPCEVKLVTGPCACRFPQTRPEALKVTNEGSAPAERMLTDPHDCEAAYTHRDHLEFIAPVPRFAPWDGRAISRVSSSFDGAAQSARTCSFWRSRSYSYSLCKVLY